MKTRNIWSIKRIIAAVCALSSFSALAELFETQGFVSFTYGGGKSEFVCNKPVAVKDLPGGRGWTSTAYEYATPDKKLGVRVTWKFYTDFDAAEYVPELYALGNEKTLPVSQLASFDFSRDDGTRKNHGLTVRVRSLLGDSCNIEMFTPEVRWLERNWVGYGALGRSSDGARELVAFDSPSADELFFAKRYPWFWVTPGRPGNMPYLCFDFPEGDGLDIAIGWSGTWRCECLKLDSLFRARAGLGKTNFRVLPGETLRAPSIVMFRRPKGTTPREMRTIKHRFMLAMKSPRDSKGELIAPVLPNTFFGGMWTDDMMTGLVTWSKKNGLPFDAFWADAGWNGNDPGKKPNSWAGWQDELGTWTVNRAVHPDGNLAKVADFVHANGAKLMLWCEPERVSPNSVLAALPQECLLSWDDARARDRRHFKVLNLGTDGGLNAAIGVVEGLIRDSHIDIYRQDCNTVYFSRYWDAADEAEGPERVGVTEMKYIAGLYKFWDAVRERHPDLLIDNCASGGRRMDIELNSRSHVYCRSDFFINHRHEDQVIAAQNATLNTLDIQPFQAGKSAPAQPGDDYAFFSAMGSSIAFSPMSYGYDQSKGGGIPEKDMAWFKKMFGVANKMRPYYLGDFYPQTEPTGLDRDVWCAYQMHRSDLDSGFVLAFRRNVCPTDALVPSLGGLKDDVDYALTSWNGQSLGTFKGAELRTRPVKVSEKRGFAMFFYSSVGCKGSI